MREQRNDRQRSRLQGIIGRAPRVDIIDIDIIIIFQNDDDDESRRIPTRGAIK
jgi:hypothetical protein